MWALLALAQGAERKLTAESPGGVRVGSLQRAFECSTMFTRWEEVVAGGAFLPFLCPGFYGARKLLSRLVEGGPRQPLRD